MDAQQFVVQPTRVGNQYRVTHGRYGPRVDTYFTRSGAEYHARLLNSNHAELHPHATIGCRVMVTR